MSDIRDAAQAVVDHEAGRHPHLACSQSVHIDVLAVELGIAREAAQPDRSVTAALAAIEERCKALGWQYALTASEGYASAQAWERNAPSVYAVVRGTDLTVLWDLLDKLPEVEG